MARCYFLENEPYILHISGRPRYCVRPVFHRFPIDFRVLPVIYLDTVEETVYIYIFIYIYIYIYHAPTPLAGFDFRPDHLV